MIAQKPLLNLTKVITVVGLGLTMVCGLLLFLGRMALPVSASPLQAPTFVSSDITVDTTWFFTGSPYIVLTSTVSVLNNSELTIEPGVEIRFSDNAQIQIPNGRLTAIGTPGSPITFTAQTTPATRGIWEGIIFGTNAGSSVIQYATIEYARAAVQINNTGGAPINVLSSTIRFVGDDDGNLNSGGAIVGGPDLSTFSYNRIYSSEIGIRLNKAGTNQISYNTIYDIDGYCIGLLPSGGLNSEDNTISNNTIYDCRNNGIRMEGLSSSSKADNNIVSNNTISNTNSEAVYALDQRWNYVIGINDDQIGIVNNNIFNTALTTTIGTTGTGSNLASIALIRPVNTNLYGNRLHNNGGTNGDYQGAVYITDTNGLALNIKQNIIRDDQRSGLVFDGTNAGFPFFQENAVCVEGSGYELENRDGSLTSTGNWWGTNLPVFGVEITGPTVITPWIALSATPAPTTLPADGLSTAIITIAMNDGAGNTVPSAARVITLSTSLGTLSANQVTLDANGVATVTLQSAATVGTAVVTATELCNYPVTTTVQFLATDLGIAKSSTPAQILPGQTITYTIPYTNGVITATNTIITDTLPAGLQWVSDDASTQGFSRSINGQDVIWTHSGLAANISDTITLVAQLPQTATTSCGQTLTNSVVITSSTFETNGANNSATDSGVGVICADVGISKTTALTEVVQGGAVTYTIAYSNAGTASAANVFITDTLPAGAGYVSDTSGLSVVAGSNVITWNVGTLNSGGSGGTFELVLSTAGSSCGASLTNQAGISTSTPDSNLGNSTTSAGPVDVACADVTLTKVSPGGLVAGTTVTYTIYYTNSGTTPAANVVITDVHPITGGVDTLVSGAILNPGQGGSVSYPVFVDLSICGATSTVDITNTAYVDTSTPESNTGNNISAVTDAVQCAPDLVITKTLAAPAASLGRPVTFTLEYHNTGVVTAPNAVITDLLSTNVTYVADTSALTPTTGSGTVAWNLGDVAPGASGSFEVGLRYDIGSCAGTTSFTNTAQIGSSLPDSNPADNSDFATSNAIPCGVDLVVAKYDGVGGPSEPAFVWAGGLITYTVNYSNAGGTDATGVVLTETLPAYTTFVGPAGPNGWTQVGATSQYTYSIGVLTASTGATLDFVVRVVPTLPVTVSTVDNQIQIDGNETDLVPADNVDTTQTPVQVAPDLAVQKSSLTPVAYPGDLVTYAITVTNQGGISTTNVLITDTLPVSTTYVSNTVIGAPVSTSTTEVVWAVGQLDPAQTVSFTMTLQTDSNTAICANVYLTNTVRAIGDVPEGNVSNNSASTGSVNSPVVACRDLVITKTIQSVAASFGKVTTFTVAYQNAGIDPMDNVIITDVLDANAEYITDTQGGAITNTGLVTWSLGTLAPGASGSFEVGLRPLICVGTSISFTNAVRIGSTTSEPYLPNNFSQTGPVTISCDEVDLVVVKNDGIGGPGQPPVVYAGDVFTYTISYNNAGGADATGVVITETLPAYTTFVGPTGPSGWSQVGTSSLYTYNIGALPSKNGDKLSFAVRVVPTLPNTITLVNNLIEIGGNQSDAFPADNTSFEQTLVQAIPDLVVAKVAQTPVVRPNDFITYRITVTNQGFGSAHNIIVTDTLPANTNFISDTLPFPAITGTGVVSWNITTLLSGGSRSFEITLQADANICLNSSVDNTAEAFGDEPDANPADNTTVETISLGCRDVGVIKSVDAPQTTLNRDVVYTLVYTNPGLITATNTLITDVLPISMTFVQSTPPHSGPVGSEYQWNVGDVPPGISGTIVITGHVNNNPALCDAILTNTGGITSGFSSGSGDQYPGNNISTADVTVRCIPDLVVLKNDRIGGPSEPPFVQAGDVFTYSILYSNIGVGAATGVVLTETLPNHTSFVAPIGANGWFQVGATSEYTYSLGTVPSGAGFQVEFAVQVENPLTLPGNFITNTVCIGGAEAEVSDTNNCSSDQTLAQSNMPRLNVSKSAAPGSGSTVQPGDTVTYTVVVLNDGQAPANNVIITDTLPLADASFVTATLSNGGAINGPNPLTASVSSLAVNESVTMTVVLNVNTAISGTLITNTTQASADSLPVQNSNTVTHVVDSGVNLLATKQADPPAGSQVNPGGLITYTLHVTNTGPVNTATGVMVIDQVPISTTVISSSTTTGSIIATNPSLVVDVNTLPVGADVEVTFVVLVDSNVVSGTVISNTGRAVSLEAVTDTNTITHVVGGTALTPLLTFSKSAIPGSGSTVDVFELITYTISVNNGGTGTASGVVITDALPISTTFISSDTTHGTVSGPDPLVANIGTLNSGETANFTFTVRVDLNVISGTVISNSGYVRSDQQPVSNTNVVTHSIITTTASLTPNVQLTKSADPSGGSTVQPGDTITYTILVSNNSLTNATSLVITDAIPTYTTYVSGSASSSLGSITVNTNSLVVDVGTLTATQSMSFSFRAVLDSPLAGGLQISNTAQANADVIGTRQSNTVTHTVVPAVDLSVTKLPVPTSGAGVNPGDPIVYFIQVRNNGSLTATNVTITDTLPISTDLILYQLVPPLGSVSGPDPFVVNVPSLAPGGGTVVFRFVVSVTNSAPTGLIIPNVAQISSDQTTLTNTNTVTHIVGTVPPPTGTLTIVKTAQPPAASTVPAGSSITYTIRVTNTGATTQTGISVLDLLDPNTSLVSSSTTPTGTVFGSNPVFAAWSSLGPGAGASLELVVNVTSPLSDGTIITNTATASSNQSPMIATNPVTHVIGTPVLTSNLVITKSAMPVSGSPVDPGQAITYTLTVLNTGTDPATNVVISDTMDSNVTLVNSSTTTGTISGPNPLQVTGFNLAAGESMTMTLGVTVTGNISGTVINNQASVTSTESATLSVSSLVTHIISSTIPPPPTLVVTKTATPASGSNVDPGQAITYTVTVVNSGPVPATSVIISDTLDSNVTLVNSSTTTGTISGPNPLQVTGFNLAAGESITVTLGVTVTGNISGTVINNQASITSTESASLGFSGLVTHVISSTIAPVPNLVVTKSAVPVSGSGVLTGSTITYTVSVANNGAGPAQNVLITDTLPLTEVSFVTATLSSGDPVNGPNPLTASVSSLAANSTVTMTIVATVNDVPTGTLITNTAQAVADTIPMTTSLPVTHQVVATTTPPVQLATKLANPASGSSVSPGDVITYSVVVQNITGISLTNIAITDTLPLMGVTYITATMSDGSSISGPNPLTATVPSLAANSAVTMTVMVTVNNIPPNVTAVIGNRADVSSDQTGITSTNVVTHLVTSRLVAVKSASPASGSTVQPGDLITYTINVQNTDINPIAGVVVTDSLPVSVTLVNSATTQGSISGSNPVVANLGTLNAGQSADITLTVQVSISAPLGLVITNTGQVGSNQVAPFDTNPVTHQIAQVSPVYLPIIFKGYAGPSASLQWVSQNEDRVSEVDGSNSQAFVADGRNDGAFQLNLNPGTVLPKTVANVRLVSSQGASVEWDTLINTVPVLGIFDGGTRLNNSDGTVNQSLTGPIVVTLYASDDAGNSRFPEDTYDYTVYVTFTDGTVVSAVARIPATPPPPSSACPVVANISVGSLPRGVVVDAANNRVYVANYGSDSVSVVDSSSNTVQQIINDITSANGIALDTNRNILWVTNYTTNQVTPIDVATLTPQTSVGVGNGPWGVAYDSVHDYVYVVNNSGNSVTVINAATQQVVTTLSGSFNQPFHIAADPVSGKAYVPNFGNATVTVINGTTVTGVIDMTINDPSTQPYGVAIDETRGVVYVAAVNSHRVVALDVNTDILLGWGEFHRGFNNPARPVPLRMVAINPDIGSIPPNMDDGGHVWMTTSTADGSEANQALMSPKGWISYFHSPIPCNLSANPSEGLAINRNLDRAYVTTIDGKLMVFEDNPSPPLVPFSANDAIGFELHIVK